MTLLTAVALVWAVVLVAGCYAAKRAIEASNKK